MMTYFFNDVMFIMINVPEVGREIPVMILKKVVLPAPFGPMRPKISPWWISRSIWSIATFVRYFLSALLCEALRHPSSETVVQFQRVRQQSMRHSSAHRSAVHSSEHNSKASRIGTSESTVLKKEQTSCSWLEIERKTTCQQTSISVVLERAWTKTKHRRCRHW